ncbi:MAG: SPOR domain-containing protein [Acidobacteriaceae bacterium]|nr:SPOR domain-containing protein [Acidobacteriaceae bacterium]
MMPGELTTTDVDWTQLQGTVLEGGYQLETILAAEESEATFKARVLGDPGANAIARIFLARENEAEQQAQDWLQAKRLASRYLAAPLGAGQTRSDGATLAYVVLRRPDETLNEAVTERPLSKEEASEVLLALARGLEQLHSHGLAHGAVSPDRIVAVGEAIQLSTEGVRSAGRAPLAQLPRARYLAPESEAFNTTPEADLWCVGATLVEILTQQRCEEDCTEQAAKLPAPFGRIALKCLETDPAARPKAGQVEALLLDQPRSEVKKASLAARSARPASVPAPANGTAAPPPPVIAMRPKQEPKLRAWWIYAAAGILVVLVLIWLLRPKQQPIATARPAASAPRQGAAWESKTLSPDEAQPAAKPVTPSAVAGAPAAASATRAPEYVKGSVWRVVLYTYAKQTDADSKARWVNAKYQGLNAETFSPSGGSPYLVVAGGRMTREEAARLRQKARGMGLPRDSYIQNYQQ